MAQLPDDGSFDSTPALLREGYAFVLNRARRLGTDAFRTRLMLRPAVCALGEEAARMFYVPGRFTRRGALPTTTLKLLQDKGSVATLDGAAHQHRKRMFMSLMTPSSIEALATAMEEEWRARLPAWQRMEEVELLEEAHAILARAVCRWAGIPLDGAEAARRTEELATMYGAAGSVGPRVLRALLLRRRTERWARGLVETRRATRQDAPGTPLDTLARHRDHAGLPLDPAVAAVELLNLLRPTVAVARFIVFAALALHENPAWQERLRAGGDDEIVFFVQEVRRLSPFFPAVAGRVLEPFSWRGHRFAAGDWAILDIYGTNRDPRLWAEPEAFRPERFRTRTPSPYAPIPQGGGEFLTGHRCAGEDATIALLRRAVTLLTRAMRYEVPAQDLRVDLARMPAAPASGFVLRAVRAA